MLRFKENDFVRYIHSNTSKPLKISNINCGVYYFEGTGMSCLEFEIKPWTPEPGDWCWFYDNETDVPTLAKLISINKLFDRKETYMVATPSCISETSYNYSRTMSFARCQPFIGELPTNLKDL